MKRLSDDPAVRLAECRGEMAEQVRQASAACDAGLPMLPVLFDEAAERASFEKHYASMNDGFCPSAYEGEYDWDDCQPCWSTWLACAHQKAGESK